MTTVHLRPQNSALNELASIFNAMPEGEELRILYDSRVVLPTLDIQPMVVCSTMTDTGAFSKEETAALSKLKGRIETLDKTVKLPGTDEQYSITRKATFEINPELAGEVKSEYTSEKDRLNEIPIYIFLTDRNAHASIMVFSRGVLYSLGLGYVGEHMKMGRFEKDPSIMSKAGLYSPDYLVRPESKTSSDKPYKYKIVDVGFLKQKHLTRINNILKSSTGDVEVSFVKDSGSKYTFQTNLIPLSLLYFMWSPPGVASAAGTYLNCASFANNIFAERVNCSSFLHGLSAAPSACTATKHAGVTAVELLRGYIRSVLGRGEISDLFKNLDDEGGSCFGSMCNAITRCFGGICRRVPAVSASKKTQRKSRRTRRTMRRGRRL
jgi:hypothetical protein